MILIDTSVWIEFFKQNNAYVSSVKSLLETQKILAIEPVFAELLYGVRNIREREIIQSYWQVLPKIGYGSNSMIDAAVFANANDYLNRGIGLMDAILVKSVLEGQHLLWTLDKRIIKGADRKLLYLP